MIRASKRLQKTGLVERSMWGRDSVVMSDELLLDRHSFGEFVWADIRMDYEIESLKDRFSIIIKPILGTLHRLSST